MTRDKRTVKFTKPVHADEIGMRLATPEVVAKYIADRLHCEVIADLGCGIGGQLLFFGKTCGRVYAVERDAAKLEMARQNCELYGVTNVEFILGDALSAEVRDRVRDADIIFSDPARPLTEHERTFESLEPPIPQILSVYEGVTRDFAFHAPPQMPPSRITYDCEREYLSLSGELNRLTLYFGSLKQCERSAVVLPGRARLTSANSPEVRESQPKKYIYEPEPSVVRAGLVGELCALTGTQPCLVEKRRVLLTGENKVETPFFKNSYVPLGTTRMDMSSIKDFLRKHDVGKAILRIDITPDTYWGFRSQLEKGLTGVKLAHVFQNGRRALVCEKLTSPVSDSSE